MVNMKKGSKNVFTDLGFDDAEAQSLQRKGEAIIAIERAMKAHRMSQAAAAKMINVSRAPESDASWKSGRRHLRSNPADGRCDRREGEGELQTASSQCRLILPGLIPP
ncbi:MAG: hypothetical protein NT024_07640 [Proteobacteria bacterium]|nr:hypothetical protein [Pseudomonadota bacterium]